MSTKIQQATATIAMAAISGLAMGQSGLDLDRAYASELRSDANTRSSLLGSNNGANVNVEVMTQFRYGYNSRDELTSGALGDNDVTMGFSTPRTQVRLSGAVDGTDISGLVVFDFGAAEGANGTASLLIAQGAWAIDDNWTVLFGRWHNPVMGSDNFAAEHTLAADKSLTNEFFQVGHTQGVAFAYSADSFKFTGAFSDGAEYTGNFGAGVANTAFNAAGEADFGVTARLDWLMEGSWDQFNDATSFRGSNYGVKLGAGLHYQTQGDTNPVAPGGAPAGFDERTVTLWTVDAQVEGDGWNLFAQYVGHKVDDDATTDADFTNHGFIVQGGYFFSDQWEGFARYDVIMLDDTVYGVATGSNEDFGSITVGANYYFVPESHAAKFTVDATFSLDESTSLDSLGFSDVNTSGFVGNSDSEFGLRAQMTLVF